MEITLQQVFTPASSASLTYVQRPYLDKQLLKALTTQGMQLIMYGQTGSGKTTYLKNKLSELNLKSITVSCTEITTIESLIKDTVDKMKSTYFSESKTQTKSKKRNRIGGGNFAFSEGLKEGTENKTSRLIQAPQVNESKLAQLLGEKGLIWVIEDFHKIKESEKSKFAQMLKVFINEADEFPSLHVIAIGAVNSAREVLKYNIELTNRIEELHVPLLKTSEIESIIDTGTKILNVGFTSEIRTAIVLFSNRIAAICHQLCFNLCINAEVYGLRKRSKWSKFFENSPLRIITGLDEFKEALADYIKSNSNTFDEAINKLNNSKGRNNIASKQIIRTLLNNQREWMTKKEIFLALEKEFRNEELINSLEKLCSPELGEILSYNTDSEQYIFSDSVFRAYLLIQHQSIHSGDFYSHSNSNTQFINEIIEKSDTFRKVKKLMEGEEIDN